MDGLTAFVNADDFSVWAKTVLESGKSPAQVCDEMVSAHGVYDIVELAISICEFSGRSLQEVGPILSYLDATLRLKNGGKNRE